MPDPLVKDGTAANQGDFYPAGEGKVVLDTFSRRTVADSCQYLVGSLKPHMHILDVGCGPGSITVDLAKHVPEGHVTGCDLESALAPLEAARAYATKEDVSNVDFRVGDALALPFPDNSFDVTHAHQVAQHVPDPVQLLREMLRVTKPGGLVACRVWDIGAFIVHPPYEGPELFIKLTTRINNAKGLGPAAGRNLHIWAKQAGYDPARIELSTDNWLFRTPEERKYISSLFASVATNSDYTARAISNGFATREDMDKIRDGWNEWVGDPDGLAVAINIQILYRK